MSGKRANGEGSIYHDADRDRWIAAVTIGRDPKTGKLIRRKVSGKTKSEAVAAKAALLAKYKDTYYIDADKLTVGEWIDKYLTTYKQNTVRENTYESYLYGGKLIKDRIGNIMLNKLLSVEVQTVINSLSDKPRAAAYALTILRMSTRRAVDDGIIARDPTRGVKKPYVAKPQIDIITPDQYLSILTCASTIVLMAAKIAYNTGMRSEEILALTWDKIDTIKHTITIDQVVINTRNGPKIVKNTKNSSSTRTITIPPKLTAELLAYRKQQAIAIMQSKDYSNNNCIIASNNGSIISSRNYSKQFATYAHAAKVAITPHGLRHTHATQLFAAGWHAKDVQERLGHASISITLDIYTHYIPSRANGIADYLNKSYPTL